MNGGVSSLTGPFQFDTYAWVPGDIQFGPGQTFRRRFDQDETQHNGYEAYDPYVPSFSQSSPTRTLNSSFRPSTTRMTVVSYSVSIATTLSLTTGQAGSAILETSSDGTTWSQVSQIANANTGTLTIGLSLTQTITGVLAGVIPANNFARIRTVNTTSTPTFAYVSGQETLL